jgi:flagella basal body P-ring formation protein FlgA
MIKVGSAVVYLLFLLIGTALPAVSDTLYILPEIVDTSGNAAVDDCVTTPAGGRGPFEVPEGAGKLGLSEISFLTQSYIEEKLLPYAIRPVRFVGEGTIYFPEEYAGSRNRDLLLSFVRSELAEVLEPFDRVELVFEDPIDEMEGKLSAGREDDLEVTLRGYYLHAWARRTLEGDAEITQTDLTVKEVPAAKKGYGAVSSAELLSGYVASRRISEGEKLTRYNTRKRIDVRAGEEITVIASRGAIEIKLSAVARESGRIGEVIGVKPRNGEKQIHARILSPREAVVDEL